VRRPYLQASCALCGDSPQGCALCTADAVPPRPKARRVAPTDRAGLAPPAGQGSSGRTGGCSGRSCVSGLCAGAVAVHAGSHDW